MDTLTASMICSFVAKAIKRGRLAAEDAAFCAAKQPVRRSALAFFNAVCAESEERWRRNATKMRERMGYASHVRESMCGSWRYGVSPEFGTKGGGSYIGGGDIQRIGGGEVDMRKVVSEGLLISRPATE